MTYRSDKICKKKLDVKIFVNMSFGIQFLGSLELAVGTQVWHIMGDLEISSHSIAALPPHYGAPSLSCR